MRRSPLSLLTLTTLLTACSLAPDFRLPELKLPEAYKEQPIPAEAPTEQRGSWKKAESLEAAEKGQWWKVFADETLNRLEEQAQAANPSLESAARRVEQSRATAEANTYSFLPDLDLNANALRSKPSDATLAAFGQRARLKPYNLYSAGGVLSYEADLFGRVRDSYRAFLFDSDARAADYNNLLLALQADVAGNYFSIRALDSEIRLVRDTVGIREKAMRIMQRKFDVGASGEQDLTRTMSELAATRADLIALERQRNVLEHALAVLLGRMPQAFSLAPSPLVGAPPELPPGLPSSLLERRPDIAAARHAMEAANARIGVARTAFFPSIALTASGGYAATGIGDLFTWSSRAWALGQSGGAAIVMPLFDSGRNLSQLDAAHAAYAESVAAYRAAVLQAFRDVEDNLSEQRLLASQSQQQDAAAAASARTTEVVQTRYDEGDIDFFEVVNAQRDALSTERAAVQVRGRRFLTAVALVRALGGGWDVAASRRLNETAAPPALPAEAQAAPARPRITQDRKRKTPTRRAKKGQPAKAAAVPPMFEQAIAAPPPTPPAPKTTAEAAFEAAVQQPPAPEKISETAPEIKPAQAPAPAYPGGSRRASFSTELNTP